jgi:intracellular sulfur oxidation DsrE/DsrF family protein
MTMNFRIAMAAGLFAVTAAGAVLADTTTAQPMAVAASSAGQAPATSKVVYHVNEGTEKAAAALRNIRNHLDAEPGAKIVVVTHAAGIDFLLDGAKDKNGNPFDAMVDTLAARGVEFRVCRNTLDGRKIDPKLVILQATIVPSGVAEIGRLQTREGFVYLKP